MEPSIQRDAVLSQIKVCGLQGVLNEDKKFLKTPSSPYSSHAASISEVQFETVFSFGQLKCMRFPAFVTLMPVLVKCRLEGIAE